MLKRYLLTLFCVALLVGSIEAYAQQDVTLSWTPPTQNTDGTPLTDLAGYKIYQGTTSGTYPVVYDVPNPGVVSYIVEGLADGTYYFAATAYNTSGIESDYSNEVAKVVETPSTPNPPLNLVVLEDNLTAYYISVTENVIRTVPLGTVPPGTPCDTSMSVNGKYVVPRDELRPAEGVTVDTQLILAECG